MPVKKIGKAKAFPEDGLWGIDTKPERYSMNERLVDLRPDIKAMKHVYLKHVGTQPPSPKYIAKREEYYRRREVLRKEQYHLIRKVYAEILEDSFIRPIPLRKDKDYDHKGDWRYCLYQGIIYQFDRPGYSGDEMISRIEQLTAAGKS